MKETIKKYIHAAATNIAGAAGTYAISVADGPRMWKNAPRQDAVRVLGRLNVEWDRHGAQDEAVISLRELDENGNGNQNAEYVFLLSDLMRAPFMQELVRQIESAAFEAARGKP